MADGNPGTTGVRLRPAGVVEHPRIIGGLPARISKCVRSGGDKRIAVSMFAEDQLRQMWRPMWETQMKSRSFEVSDDAGPEGEGEDRCARSGVLHHLGSSPPLGICGVEKD